MSNIYILNPDSKSGSGSKFGLNRLKKIKKDFPQIEIIEDTNIAIHLKDSKKSLLVIKNNPTDIREDFLFINKRRMREASADSYYVALIGELFLQKKDKISNKSFTYTKDYTEKIHQMIRFNNAGITIPETIIANKATYTKNKKYINQHTIYPCVLKTNGANGKSVWKIENQKELNIKIDNLNNEVFMIQEFIPNNFDVRVLVFGDKILGAIKRESSDGFKNNLSQGGKGSEFKLTKQEENFAKKAVKVNNALFGGVDIVFNKKNKPVILEVNRRPAGMHSESGFMKKAGLSIDTEKLIIEEIIKKYL